MDSLKSKMKDMNIDKDKLDRTSSITKRDHEKGRYLSTSSYDAVDRPPSPNPQSPTSPTTPTFRMTLPKGSYPGAGAVGSNDVIANLKDQLNKDRMSLGLKQTRGGVSPIMRNMRRSFNKKDEALYGKSNNSEYVNVLPPDALIVEEKTPEIEPSNKYRLPKYMQYINVNSTVSRPDVNGNTISVNKHEEAGIGEEL